MLKIKKGKCSGATSRSSVCECSGVGDAAVLATLYCDVKGENNNTLLSDFE